jgi:hypothetical protein
LIWTITANGKTERAYASLKPGYAIDKQTISTEVGGDLGSLNDKLRTNIPPELRVEGQAQRSVKVNEPLQLVAFARDPDNVPARRDPRGRSGGGSPTAPATSESGARSAQPPADRPTQLPPPASLAARSGPGLRFSWMVYRGSATSVTFTPDQMKTWMDTRIYANSPWSPPYLIPDVPPEGKWLTQATFREPGVYVLRGVASDGSLFTYENVTVTVTP